MLALYCGSRNWADSDAIADSVAALPEGSIVIEGGARGADRLAGYHARRRGLFVAEVECAKAHWDLFGNRAGHKRNHAMLDLRPDRVVAFQVNGSNGTQGTIDEARRRGIPVQVYSS